MTLQLRFRPPSYWRAASYQLYKQTNGTHGWDGYLCPLKFKGKLVRGGVVEELAESARGHLDDMVDAAVVQGVELKQELLPRPFKGLEPEDIPDDLVDSPHDMDEHQRQCVANWLREAIGINHAAVNAGKTLMFAVAAAFIKRTYPDARFLYFTHSERLVKQVYDEMRKLLPGWRVGKFGGGSHDKDAADMVVATMAMLSRHYEVLHPKGWFKSFMAVLADESHHVASPTCQKVLKVTPAFFRLGASDTLAEDDVVKHHLIKGMLGPMLDYEIESHQLIEVGRSARPSIYVVDDRTWAHRFNHLEHTPAESTSAFCLVDGEWAKGTYMGPVYEPDPDTEDGIRRDKKGNPVTVPDRHLIHMNGLDVAMESRWCLLERTYDRSITRFNERNKLIAEWAHHYHSQELPTLIICTRTLHILILEALVRKLVGAKHVKILYSRHSSKERDATFDWLRHSQGGVLISPLAKEGVSINELRAGIIADHVVSWEVAEQMIGRFIRRKLTGPNEAHVTLFLDRQHTLYRAASVRLLKKLETVKSYDFYYPVVGPDTISQAKHYTVT